MRYTGSPLTGVDGDPGRPDDHFMNSAERLTARLALRCWSRRELTWSQCQRELAAANCSPEQADELAREMGL